MVTEIEKSSSAAVLKKDQYVTQQFKFLYIFKLIESIDIYATMFTVVFVTK